MKQYFLFFLTSILIVSCDKVENIKVNGTIYDQRTFETIENATISIIQNDRSELLVAQTVSDKEGNFILQPNLSLKKEYTLIVKKMYYKDYVTNFNLTNNSEGQWFQINMEK